MKTKINLVCSVKNHLLWLIFAALLQLPLAATTSSPARMRVFKDDLGRKIELPARVNRLLSLQPEITRILIALRAEQKLVGIDYFIHHFDHLYSLLRPRLGQLPVASMSGENVNLELVLQLKPDLIFASPSEAQLAPALQAKTGIPTIALASMGNLSKLLEEINLIAEMVNNPRSAKSLVAFFHQKVTLVKSRVTHLKPQERPRVYLCFWSSLTRTPVSYEPVEVAGGTNLAQGLIPLHQGTAATSVALEKILVWNPDIILIHGNYPPSQRAITREMILNDRRLAQVKAVRFKRVYYTFGFWYWWDPAQVLVEILYLAKLFHPQLFKDVNLKQAATEIYQVFYGLPKAFSHLMTRLNWQAELDDTP